jgi:hypothetical protein
MRKSDFYALVILLLFFLPFFVSDGLYRFYSDFNSGHAYITSFIKFAVLATYGEVLGLRIRTGGYRLAGFGLVPRAKVWGVLGLAIKAAFTIFSAGTPVVLAYLGVENPASALAGSLSAMKLLIAFCISLSVNLVFSPVLMTLHRITDSHIALYKGSLRALVHPVEAGKILTTIDWKMHWGFVLKKTIPLFWIPAHTLTFLLPVDYQILFAALLGVVLGVILAFAAGAKSAKQQE